MRYIDWRCPSCGHYPNKWDFVEGHTYITCSACKNTFWIEGMNLELLKIYGSGLVAKAQPDVMSK